MVLIKENVERIADNPRAIALLKADGYKEVTKNVDTSENSTGLKTLSKDKLKALAKENGLEGYEDFTKEQLLDVLKDVV